MLGDFADRFMNCITCCFLSGIAPTKFMITASTPFLVFDDVAINDSNRRNHEDDKDNPVDLSWYKLKA